MMLTTTTYSAVPVLYCGSSVRCSLLTPMVRVPAAGWAAAAGAVLGLAAAGALVACGAPAAGAVVGAAGLAGGAAPVVGLACGAAGAQAASNRTLLVPRTDFRKRRRDAFGRGSG